MKSGGEKNRQAYIIGSGIAGLAAATFLIKDGGMKGDAITIIDSGSEPGGSFDGQGSAQTGYSARGLRMFEKDVYSCTYDLLAKITSPTNPRKTLKDDFFEFNRRVKVKARARLITRGQIINAQRLGLNWGDRLRIFKLIYLPEKFFGNQKISDYFSADIFISNFWAEWSTTFSFQPWHSLIEMRRYLIRFFANTESIATMQGMLSMPYCEHDFIIRPLVKQLQGYGVKFKYNNAVRALEFVPSTRRKIVSQIILKKSKLAVTPHDLVFFTNGSITADSTMGTRKATPKSSHKKSVAWDLWKSLAVRWPDLGRPEVFANSRARSHWTSFTLTCRGANFFKLIEKMTGNVAGTGGLITLKDSNWFLTLSLPEQPYFIGQPKNTFVCWGYGLSPDRQGNFIKKKMTACSGQEILAELCYHLGIENKLPTLVKQIICLPVLLPYITSQFQSRRQGDRPLVVPRDSQNLALIGQYVEIPQEIVFTVEASVRSAKLAVNQLLRLKTKLPPLYQGQFNPKLIIKAIKTALR